MQIRDTILPIAYTQHLNGFQELIEHIQDEANIIERSQKSKMIANTSIHELRKIFDKHPITSAEEEIQFFKVIKPFYLTQLIHHHDILSIESGKPLGDQNTEMEYFIKQSQKIKLFFDDHDTLFKYFRSGSTEKDTLFFTRGHLHEIPIRHLDPIITLCDEHFSTGYDFILSQINASTLTNHYINQEIFRIQNPQKKPIADNDETVQWTASVIDFVEMICMLIADGAVNNGHVTTTKLARVLGKVLNIKVEFIPKKKEELRLRKINRTKFIDRAKRSLTRMFEEEDENAL